MRYIHTGRLESPMKTKHPKETSAFTLVEVVLALGIIAFAFVPIIGLLPVGLNMSHQAIDTTTEAQIAQELSTEVQQTDFSVLINPATQTNFTSGGAAPPSYFDNLGNTTSQTGAVYEAGLVVTGSTALPSGSTTQNLATVTIYILNITSGRTSQNANPIDNPDWKMFSVLIPNNGR